MWSRWRLPVAKCGREIFRKFPDNIKKGKRDRSRLISNIKLDPRIGKI